MDRRDRQQRRRFVTHSVRAATGHTSITTDLASTAPAALCIVMSRWHRMRSSIFSFLFAISDALAPPRANRTRAAELDVVVKPHAGAAIISNLCRSLEPPAPLERTDGQEKKDNYRALRITRRRPTLHSVLSDDLTRKWPDETTLSNMITASNARARRTKTVNLHG